VQLVDELAAVVGADHVLSDPERAAPYTTDWTGRFSGEARCVVRPATTAEVAEVMRACARHGATVVPQGGNTGLVGGGVPRNGEVLVTLTRLDALEPVDVAGRTVVAGAGATLGSLQAHAAAAGLSFGVDLAARDSATVGGMVATNAGGLHVLRHGSMRRQVRGVEAVLADGRVLQRLGGLEKDNTGYDLPGLLTGSEGTLAILTRVCVRLVATPPHRATALLAVPDVEEAVSLAGRLQRQLSSSLEALEVLFADGLDMVCGHSGLSQPFARPAACYLVVECASSDDPVDALAAAAGTDAVLDAAVATDRPARARLWAYRELLPEALSARGVPVKLDVTVPLRRLPGFVDALPDVVATVAADAEAVTFGHLAEGNLHVNVLGGGEPAAVEDAVLGAVVKAGGSVSAEHGVGVAKRRWVRFTRGEVDRSVMWAVKQAFDPAGLLNPGVLHEELPTYQQRR
jgi:FAD/FMN-containing dehydrogenase